MGIDVKLDKNGTHFNATKLVRLRNTVTQHKAKRLHDFTHTGKRNAYLIDLIECRWGEAVKVTGAGIRRQTWLRLPLLPVFMNWLGPKWYLSLYDEEPLRDALRAKAKILATDGQTVLDEVDLTTLALSPDLYLEAAEQ